MGVPGIYLAQVIGNLLFIILSIGLCHKEHHPFLQSSHVQVDEPVRLSPVIGKLCLQPH